MTRKYSKKALNKEEMGTLKSVSRPLSEIGVNKGVDIEKVEGPMSKQAAELEAFMHEEVVIRIGRTTKEDLPVEVPCVNSINQPIMRGKPQAVKRKYVESLARSHIIEYEQETPDASKPDQILMVAKPAFCFPIEIMQDTPKGVKWYEAIRANVQMEVARG